MLALANSTIYVIVAILVGIAALVFILKSLR
jgi:hypothetical protein